MTESQDLFSGAPTVRATSSIEAPRELRIARSLCRQIKRTASRPDKVRLAHELCGTLIALCRKQSRT